MARVPISVVILNYNRKDLLRRALTSLEQQRLPPLEIIVVDNASSDGAPAMVERDFPGVRLMALTENCGIKGRNLGMKGARGELILSLDNDIELTDPETLATIEERFASNSSLGAVSLKICEGRDYAPAHWWHPRPRQVWQDREFATDHFNEAAVAFRSSAIREAGYYYEPLYWGGEEWDLALGLLDCGYEIRYLPVPVMHLAPRGSLNEQPSPRHALLIRNRLWIAFRRLPVPWALAHVLPRLPVWAARSARFGYFRFFCRGLWDFLTNLPAIIRSRRAISPETRRRLRSIRSSRSGFP